MNDDINALLGLETPEDKAKRRRLEKNGGTELTTDLDGIPMYTIENLAIALNTTPLIALSIMEEIGVVRIGDLKLVSREALRNFLEGRDSRKKRKTKL